MTFDVVVIGAGLAGLAAALRCAEAGRRVAVLAKGIGSTHLAPATVDVLGYAPDRVESPARELPAFAASHPGHPYARVGPETVGAALAWFRERVGVYAYVGDWDGNILLPTAVGAAKPSALVPETMAAGDLRGGPRLLLVGLRALKDFYPDLAAANLAAGGVTARGVMLDLHPGEAEVGTLALARRFEDPEFLKAVAAALDGRLAPDEAVGFPAVLGLQRARSVWATLQDRLGAPVFEVPTLPPSAPGIRLFEDLKGAIRRAGGRVVIGSPVVGAETSGGRVEAVVAESAARPVRYSARAFVLASGGFASGGIEMDSRGAVREAVFGLPVAGVPPEGEPRFHPDYLDDHPLSRAGLAVDGRLRPLGQDGEPVHDNVHAAGAVLGGAAPWREKSGDGISLATGYAAGGFALEVAG